MNSAAISSIAFSALALANGANIHACFRQSCFAPSPTPGYNALHQLWDRSNSGKLYADMRDFLLRAGIQPAD